MDALCYRAANWVLLGRTTGRGKDDVSHTGAEALFEVLQVVIGNDNGQMHSNL